MVDYRDGDKLFIEEVDHSIHILGVQAQAVVSIFWGFLAALAINPIFAPFGALIFCFIARFFFTKEELGIPYPYNQSFLQIIKKYPVLKFFFPTLTGIVIGEEVYRG